MSPQVTAFAPGRVNLIGEHTDYNGGLALPFAIADGITVTATRIAGDRIETFAADLGGHDTFALHHLRPAPGWRAFVRGAAAELTSAGSELTGTRLRITGSLPPGSGLSSSAALTVALCLALLAAARAQTPPAVALAQLCSRVENEWVGARTGLLDQLASLCGLRDHALRIDFASLSVDPVPLALGGHRLVTLDSGERHSHAAGSHAGGYNERRAECAEACRLLAIANLSEATAAMVASLPEPLAARARHVLTENARVEQTVAALRDRDLVQVGALLDASHASLRDDFAVSTPAVERTVERLHAAGALGARIMGGGFGGHVLGLLPPDARPPEGALVVTPSAGARLL